MSISLDRFAYGFPDPQQQQCNAESEHCPNCGDALDEGSCCDCEKEMLEELSCPLCQMAKLRCIKRFSWSVQVVYCPNCEFEQIARTYLDQLIKGY